MSEGIPKPKRIYMDTQRSTINPAIAANIFKEYDPQGNARYHYEISRAWKSKAGETGYSTKFFEGVASAIAEVSELAELTIQQANKAQFSIGRKLTEKLSEKLTETQTQAISVEKYHVIEDAFMHIKDRGENNFWQIVTEAVAETKQNSEVLNG